MEWTWFRAIAARVGWSREQVEAVERAGETTYLPHPLNADINIRVRPDPDWTERMGDAWEGVLVNSRRVSAGIIRIADGRLLIADADAPERNVIAHTLPGDFEVVVTIASIGAQESGDYEEYVSHAFALLQGAEAAAIEPMTGEDGAEIDIEAYTLAFASSDAAAELAANASAWPFTMREFLARSAHLTESPDGHWRRAATSDGAGALVAMRAGEGKGTYPIFRIADAEDRNIGVLLDLYVDNRPD